MTHPAPSAVTIGVSLRGSDTHQGLAEATGTCRPDGYPTIQGTNSGGRFGFVIPAIVPDGHGLNLHFECPGYLPFDTRVNTEQKPDHSWDFDLQPAVAPFPDPPSRADACEIKTHFQGLWIDSPAFSQGYRERYGSASGQIPYYGGSSSSFWAAGEFDGLMDQLVAAGDTHVFAPWMRGGTGYDEPGQCYGLNQLIPPANQSPEDYLAMVDAIIRRGLKPVYIVSGEGQDGYEDIKANFPALVALLRRDVDRLVYGPVLVAYDGVWPDSWSVAQMKEMIPWMRSVLGDSAYLGFMFSGHDRHSAYLWIETADDYQQPWCDGLDIVATTDGMGEAEGVSLANKAGYMLRSPNFSEFQPDQGTHFIFHDCSRGARVYIVIEWGTYQSVRDPNQQYKATIDAGRERMKQMGYPGWG